jgi:putative DNA primase/helicase
MAPSSDQDLASLLAALCAPRPAATLHRANDLLAISPGRPIYIAEVEADADRLWSESLPATSPTGGLDHWQPAHADPLRGHDVVIIAPTGQYGLDIAVRVGIDLHRVASTVRVILLDSLTHAGSISGWFDLGGTAAELDQRARDTPPLDYRSIMPSPVRPTARVTRLSAVTPRPVEWLWQGWLPVGKLAILGGHPGVGKSTLAAAIAAILSVAAGWPDGTPAPLASTIFLLAEDAADDTLRPRLDLLGADPARILTLDAVSEADGSEVYFNLGKHLDALEDAILAESARLVIIDPLSAFLPRRNRNDEGDIRDLLTPLARMAERLSVAVLAIMHVGKQSSGRTALQSLLGTTAFGAIARSVIMAAPIPGSDRNALAVVKSNLADAPSPLAWSRPLDGPLIWHGPTHHTMETLLGGLHHALRTTSLDAAEAFLLETLASGPVPAATVEQTAAALGIPRRTLERARRSLAIESRLLGNEDLTWYLMLAGTKME